MDQGSPVFAAISDGTRRAILDHLQERDLPAGELASRFSVSRPAISRHLRVLRGAGLVHETRHGRHRVYSLQPEPLAAVDAWLVRYRSHWAARLMDLKSFVESTNKENAS